ncbi:hypothetical protein W97_09188 [Coniosporium apollinis CBS 100218]|uniref:Uncharacterized protein n=1 Tax=Coniosporium apollinis (strain CBS 100218) TaxID=1168221 RepID=R7Z738_CONA1|nr:uncharacterized protein W97_09188 [Coniosporium apollinis CBS 100218]EON69923.1 hypothetical protein W97_09188 [Coniosporium apollinis CBS 100218]
MQSSSPAGPLGGDPFENIRHNLSAPCARKVFDDYDENDTQTMLGMFKNLYHRYAHDSSLRQLGPGRGTLSSTGPYLVKWKNLIIQGLVHDEVFQRMVVDDIFCHRIVEWNALRLQEPWLQGIYFPGFYDLYSEWDASPLAALSTFTRTPSQEQNLTQDVIQRAKHILISLIQQFEGHHREEHDITLLQEIKLPATDTDPYVLTLLKLVMTEKRRNNESALLTSDLQDNWLTPDLGLGQRLEEEAPTQPPGNTIIDGFGATIIGFLKQARPITISFSEPDVPTDVVSRLKSATGEARPDKVYEGVMAPRYEDNAEQDSYIDDPRLYDWLATVDKGMSCCTFYPGFYLPLCGAIRYHEPESSRQNQSSRLHLEGSEELMDTPSVGSLHHNSGRHTSAALDPRVRTDSDADVLEGAENYVRKEFRTKDSFSIDHYDACIGVLSGRYARPISVIGKPNTHYVFRSFNRNQLLDNWYHVRGLLYVIPKYYNKARRSLWANCTQTEEDLCRCFSAIVAAKDPIPWILGLEWLLRDFWRKIVQALRAPHDGEVSVSSFESARRIFNELCLLSHGIAIAAIVTRHRFSTQLAVASGNEPGRREMTRYWYIALRQWDDICAGVDCQASLPPSLAHSPSLRQMLAAGTRELRIGDPDIRGLFSNNRDTGYPCLYAAIVNVRSVPL